MSEASVLGREGEGTPDRTLSRAFGSWESLLERLPVGVYVCGRDGKVAHYNRRAGELWGQTPGQATVDIHYCRALKAFDTEGRALRPSQAPIAEVLATGQPVKDREIIIEHGDGRRLHLLANAEPLFDDAGDMVGAVNCIQDVTELRRARDLLRARQGWSRRILETSPVAVYQTDAEGRVLGFNAAAAVLWGREPVIGEDRWCGSHKLFTPDGVPMPLDQCSMAQAIRDRRQIAGGEAIFERPDGSRGAFLAYPTPLFGPDGELVGAVSLLVDISERKRAEDLQKTLLDELNHRVKNTLATVQSLATHSFHDDGGDPAGMRRAFEARLMALSGAHNQLAERRWETADLRDIVAGIFAPYGSDAVLSEGPSVQLSTRASVTFAMVLHELAANAVKYGALSTPEGRLLVHWTKAGETLSLEWRETGGPPATQPQRRGFGLRFVRGAVERELAGAVEFDFAEPGLRCRMSAPIPPAA